MSELQKPKKSSSSHEGYLEMWITTSLKNTKYLVSETVDQSDRNYWL